MATASAAAAVVAQREGQGVRSREAHRAAYTLLEAPIPARRQILRNLDQRERAFIFRETREITGSLYGLWADDPVGFVEDVLGESIWTKQREILEAIPHYKRVMVPAGFGVGKTHLMGRVVLFFCNVHPPGTALCVTTATRFRQVRNQLWPHIRRAHARSGLPGECDTVQYKIPDQWGNDVLAAYGFTAPANDEAAMQGIHSNKLLLIVDEAGGIAKPIGEGTNNLLTGDASMVAIGNPPTDDPNSWFEVTCEEGVRESRPGGTITIPIAATDSPAITGQPTPRCLDCPPGVPAHSLAKHLPDQEWVDRTIRAYGPDHPYVIAKVHARFPKASGALTLPVSWVDAGRDAPEPEEEDGTPLEDYVRLDQLGLEHETEPWLVKRGAWIRLGVDVASDGGDELTMYRSAGDMVQFRHASSGAENADAVAVAEKVLDEILRAEELVGALGTVQPVRVKVDANGLGWGVASMLTRWGKTGRHHAQIVPVMVSESPYEVDEAAVMRPWRKRDEAWLAMRFLLQPDPSTGFGRLRLRVDEKCLRQMSLPKFSTNSSGFVVVESKKSLRQRGLSSTDRADGLNLAVYEPEPVRLKRRRGLLN